MIIKNQQVNVSIGTGNIKRYKNLGYDVKIGDIINVDVSMLPKGSHVRVDVLCDYCGDITQTAYRDYIKCSLDGSYACKHCNGQKYKITSQQKRGEKLYNRAAAQCKLRGYEILTDKKDICNSESRIIYNCPKHGIHDMKIYSMIMGFGCPDCKIDNMKLSPDYVEKYFNSFGIILLNKEDYAGSRIKNLKAVCPSCSQTFITSYNNLSTSQCPYCPSCSHASSSGEIYISDYLDKKGIEYIREYTFNDCVDKRALPFDFYLPKLNIIIEFDGRQHYMPTSFTTTENAELNFKNTQYHDEIKNNFCKNHNIDLIRIPYWDFINIDKILDKELFT